jgi:hypothetical protein
MHMIADLFPLLTQSSHTLRYVLKNRKTNEPLWVMVFTLQPKDGEKTEVVGKAEPVNDDLD